MCNVKDEKLNNRMIRVEKCIKLIVNECITIAISKVYNYVCWESHVKDYKKY